MNSPQPASAPLVQIEDLCVTFTGGKLPVQAVSGVTLNVARGQVMALIGESGSGKSVTLRTLLRLHPERRTQMRGKVLVDGRDVLALSPRELNDYRGKIHTKDCPDSHGSGQAVDQRDKYRGK